MPITMYEASVPVFTARLKALAGVLGEGERNAAENGKCKGAEADSFDVHGMILLWS